MTDSGLSEVLRALHSHDHFLVTSHIHPDGDNIGSVLAMNWLLRRLGKQAFVVLTDPVPAAFAFMPGADEILSPETFRAKGWQAQTVVILDAGDMARVGETVHCFPPEAPVIIVDHHPQSINPANTSWVRPEAAATGEMVYELIRELGLTPEKGTAMALYTAIFTDTGGFRFNNTTGKLLEQAAELVYCGADPSVIAEKVYDTKPLLALKLLGEALHTLQVSRDGQVAWIAISDRMLQASSAGPDETDGFVNYARMVAGVKVAVLFREMGNGEVKVSWRSRRGTDVGEMAREMGGGGHVNAAGSIYRGNLEAAVKEVLSVISRRLPASI